MRYLLWTYYAPLSAHSLVATGQDITTSSRPTRTGALGVLASCLGIERTRVADITALHDGIGFAVRVDNAGARVTDYHTAMVPRGEEARGQLSRWHELQAGRPEAQQTYRDYVVGGLYTVAHWERAGSRVSLDQIMTALGQPIFAPFAGRVCCSFALPFEPLIVEADGLLAAFTQRQTRPEVAKWLRLKPQKAVEVAADEDSGLNNGRVEQRMDGYAGLRAWSSRKQIVTEITNG
jgi:CRISPR-associated protein Cas5/CasD subtype I-E